MINKKALERARALVQSIIESTRDEAQEKFDEKSDAWKEGDKGQEMEVKIDSLINAYDNLSECESNLDDATRD